jgi:Mg-chelatase subunit ChlI
MKSARSLTAFRNKDIIETSDIKDAAQLSLSHRMKRLPFEEIGKENEKILAALSEMQT